jgi:hypothetical protein
LPRTLLAGELTQAVETPLACGCGVVIEEEGKKNEWRRMNKR